jgi:hypothetical protein
MKTFERDSDAWHDPFGSGARAVGAGIPSSLVLIGLLSVVHFVFIVAR